MSEWRTIGELWEEHGGKPIDMELDGYIGVYHIISATPDKKYFMGWHTESFRPVSMYKKNHAKLHTPEPVIKPHWPVIYNDGWDSVPKISRHLYVSEIAAENCPRLPATARVLRLATELPPILLEISK